MADITVVIDRANQKSPSIKNHPSSGLITMELTVLSSKMNEFSKRKTGAMEEEPYTLQEASMLCNVTQTATTLSTGDHSFPRIDAHI
jgi:hypothetical protein